MTLACPVPQAAGPCTGPNTGIRPAEFGHSQSRVWSFVDFVRTKCQENDKNAEEPCALAQAVPVQRTEADVQDESRVIIGEETSLKSVFDIVHRVAKTASTVLVTGETGTGKELVVRTLHDLSGRKGHFVAVNCGAMPGDLIESELFGAEKGAYTGASQSRPGRFEYASNGTLFLDEIGEMPLHLQVKILRALQEKEVQRLGGHTPIKVNVRVVAATNKDLEQEVRNGTFREDLYYRLSVIPIHLPPLRERGNDILALARYYLDACSRENGLRPMTLDAEAERILLAYEWPGNVRELENIMNRMCVLRGDDCVTADDLPGKLREAVSMLSSTSAAAAEEDSAAVQGEPVPGSQAGPGEGQTGEGQTQALADPGTFVWPDLDVLQRLGLSLRDFLSQMEDHLITQALEREQGVHHRAAMLLGIKRTTLIEKLKRKAAGRA